VKSPLGGLASVAAALLTQSLLALALSVLLARSLGPAGRGLYGTVTLLVLLAGALGTMGFDTGNAYAVARNPALGPSAFTASLGLALAAGTTIPPLLLGLARSGFLGPLDLALLGYAALAVPAVVVTPLLQGVLAGLGLAPRGYWLNASGVAFTLLGVAFAAWIHPRAPGPAIVAFAAAQLLGALVLVVATGRAVSWRLADPRPMISLLLTFNLTSHVANVLHLLHLRVDVLLVNRLLADPRQVGFYVLAQGLCEWLWLLPRAAAVVHLPAVAGAAKDVAWLRTARLSRLTLLLAGLGAIGLAVTAMLMLPAVYGPAFSASIAPLLILLPGVVAGSVAGVLSAHLTGQGRPDLPLLNALASLLANVGLNLLLLPRAGILGAAAASAITYSVCTLINMAFLRQREGLPLATLVPLHGREALDMLRVLGRALRPKAWGERRP